MHSFETADGLYGVIGFPLSQSLSPVLHNWGFNELQLPHAYYAWTIPGDALPAFTVSLRCLPIHGASVTLPHKQHIIPYVDHLTSEARSTAAVNTLFWREGELWGENTDVAGFLSPLKRRGEAPESALILGSGGAGLACIHGLRTWGVDRIMVAARRREPLQELRRKRGIAPLAWEDAAGAKADLLINATPLGMRGKSEGESPLPGGALQGFKTVYDLVYNPLQTKLLKDAAAAGCQVLSGLEMFIEQGRKQFELWTGQSFDPDRARQLLLKRLKQE